MMRETARSRSARLGALLLLAGSFSGAASAQAPRSEELIAIHQQLNGMCRGWSGDDPHTQQVCDVRDRLGGALKQAGYCFGRRGQVGAQMSWHRCGPDSLR
jgi:hypothetical protein